MSNVGRLIQQYVTIEWGGTNLSYMDDGEGGKTILAQDISFQLEAEDAAPSCDFSITPNPLGFKIFTELKTTAIAEPIKVTVGYPNSDTKITQVFRYSGMSMTTGHSPKIAVTGVSVLKGPMTDNKVSYTLEKPMTLKDLPEFLKEKAGEGAKNIKFQWVGTAEEYASGVQYQENIIDRTPYSILVDAMRIHGIVVQPGDSGFDGTVVLSRDPAFEGEQEKDKPVVAGQGTKAEPAKRGVYIIGPGLMEDLTRKQTFNMGQSNPKGGASKKKSASYEQDQKEVQTASAGATQVVTAQSGNTTGGTTGASQTPSTMSKTKEASGEDAKKGRQAATDGITTDLSFDCLMVPYLVGIKPRDFCVIPSLAGPGNYLEDWAITSVKYTQNSTGDIRVSISAQRPFTGDKNLLDGATVAAVKATVSTLTTPAKWNKFYWYEGADPDYPLAG